MRVHLVCRANPSSHLSGTVVGWLMARLPVGIRSEPVGIHSMKAFSLESNPRPTSSALGRLPPTPSSLSPGPGTVLLGERIIRSIELDDRINESFLSRRPTPYLPSPSNEGYCWIQRSNQMEFPFLPSLLGFDPDRYERPLTSI